MDVWAETGLEDRSGVARMDLSVVSACMVEVPLREAQGNRKVLRASSIFCNEANQHPEKAFRSNVDSELIPAA